MPIVPVDVPNVPGVPPVIFATTAGETIIDLLDSDGLNLFGGFITSQQYGIFLGGAAVVLADNVVAFGFKQQWSIADFPVERGSFESYNKVAVPFTGVFKFSCGGSNARRTAFLASIQAIAGDLNLYTIVTPDAVYPNVNIQMQDYNRQATQGAGLLTVEVQVTEIRQATAEMLSNTQDPAASAQQNTGTVQATAPSQGILTGTNGLIVGGI